ncbi:MAG: hypothetical protein ABFS05_01055 [Bacteroidota bacterium]
MKKIILTSVIILATLISFAGNKKYFQAMKKNLTELEKAKSATDFQSLADNFARIGEAEGDKWLPYYYEAFSLLESVFSCEGKADIDKVMDKAEAVLEKARELSPKNSEIEVLQGWIYQGRIQVDIMGRGMIYSQKAAGSFSTAKEFNPDNPRIYFLTGQNVLHTPEAYGGGKKAACPYFLIAQEKYASFKPETSISPNWGSKTNNKLADGCEL